MINVPVPMAAGIMSGETEILRPSTGDWSDTRIIWAITATDTRTAEFRVTVATIVASGIPGRVDDDSTIDEIATEPGAGKGPGASAATGSSQVSPSAAERPNGGSSAFDSRGKPPNTTSTSRSSSKAQLCPQRADGPM